MSSRAHVVGHQARVERFSWTTAWDPGDPVELERVDPPDEGPPPAEEPEPPLPVADHQAHLASLERDAFAKGYAQGERAGLEAGAKRADAMLRRVAQTIEDLGQLRRTIVRETERQMVELALVLARRVVNREVSLDPTLVAAMAHVALERLGETTPATIRLNPDDYAAVTAQRTDGWEGSHVAVLPDRAVARGGCVVESEFGVVDGRLDAQFDELTRALLGDGPTAASDAGRHEE